MLKAASQRLEETATNYQLACRANGSLRKTHSLHVSGLWAVGSPCPQDARGRCRVVSVKPGIRKDECPAPITPKGESLLLGYINGGGHTDLKVSCATRVIDLKVLQKHPLHEGESQFGSLTTSGHNRLEIKPKSQNACPVLNLNVQVL